MGSSEVLVYEVQKEHVHIVYDWTTVGSNEGRKEVKILNGESSTSGPQPHQTNSSIPNVGFVHQLEILLLLSSTTVLGLASCTLKQPDFCHGPTISLDSQVKRSVRLTLELFVWHDHFSQNVIYNS